MVSKLYDTTVFFHQLHVFVILHPDRIVAPLLITHHLSLLLKKILSLHDWIEGVRVVGDYVEYWDRSRKNSSYQQVRCKNRKKFLNTKWVKIRVGANSRILNLEDIGKTPWSRCAFAQHLVISRSATESKVQIRLFVLTLQNR